MKRLLIAIAAAATTMFASAAVIESEDFEGSSLWTGVTAAEYGGETPVALQYPFTATNAKYGVLDDDASSPAAEGATCFDMYVQFKPLTEEPAELADGAKLAVYADADGFIHVLTTTGNYKTEGTVDYDGADKWVRLTIVAEAEAESKGYKVYVNGGDPILGAVEGSDDSVSVFPAETGAKTVEFTGSGKLDNFVARTTNPFVTRTTEVVGIGDFATGGEYFTEVSDEAIAAAAAAGLPLTLYGNAALTATLKAGDSFTLIKGGYELTGLDDKYAVDGNTYTRVSVWSDYLGDAVAGAYEIDNLTELKAFQANVGTLPTANLTFKLTADITLDAAWEGIGVKAGKDLVNGDTKDIPTYEAGAFCGTFNGQGHTISSFQMENGTDYGGFFNSVNGATIENLNISYKENKLCANSSATGGDTGATFVGVARNSTLQYLTALATESVDTVSASKDMAGIVAYLMAGSTVDSCTNELNVASLLTSKARKSGGIALITQDGTGTATIRNCKNSGTVTLANAGGQAGGIVGYVGQSTTIENCENTAAVKMLTHMGNTVTLQGVNKGNATVASYTGNATPGLNFATVDGDVATFVADDALVLDGTVEYKVMNANAAYAFAAAGTLALDQSLATATVTADTSKFVFTTSEPVDNVTTYTAVAGVASVGGQAYATMQDAFDAVTAQNNTVTLLSDLTETVTLNPNETVTITLVPNNHKFATAAPFAAANGIVLGVLSDNGDDTWSMNVINNKASTWTGTAGDELWATASNWSTGVVPGQYTTVTFGDNADVGLGTSDDVRYVAGLVVNGNVNLRHDTRNYAYYPSVQICGGNVTGTGTLTLERCGLRGNNSQVEVGCNLVFKGDSATTHDCFLQEGPFVFNGAVSSTLGRLHLLTPVTFNGSVTLGNATMTSTVSGGAAPTFNGPVTLNSGASITTYAVTYNNALTIGEGAVVSVGSTSQTYGDNFVLTGSGRFIGDTVDVGAKVKTAFQDSSSWTGTYEIKGRNHSGGSGKDMGNAWWLTAVGNVNSKVCFNGVTTYLNNSNSGSNAHGIAGIEIGAGGLTLDGGYKGGNWELPSLSGTGTLTIAATGSTGGNAEKAVIFPADCSDFAGNIAFGDADSINVRVVFGTSERTFATKSIVVGSGAEVGAGAWTAANGIFVDGTVSLASASSALTVPEGGVVGSGKIVASAVPTTAPALDADNWTGTFVADWEGEVLSANKGKRIDFNSYGTANSIVEVTKLARGYDGTGSDYTVVPTVKVSGTMTLDNGYSGKITTLTKLTGSGAVTFKNYTVNITTLDNFTGTLDAQTATTISDIVTAGSVASGTCLVKTTAGSTVNQLSNTKVNGEAANLEFKAEAEQPGIYVAEPPAPKVAEVVNGEQYETLAEALAAATDGATVKLLDDITLDARVEPNLGAGTALTIDLGGYTITREGTSGNGSAFDVKSGTVTIKNGTIDCTQDDTAIVKDGVYAITARSGAAVTLQSLTVAVNSQAGACAYPFAGATLAITSGTYRNNTAEPYQYKTGWTGMAVNQANVEQQLITISGGSFYQVNPAEGDDSGKVTSFLAANCESTYDSVTGFWTVAEVQEVPVTPGAQTDPVETQAEAEAAAAKVVPSVPAAVAEALSDDQETAYKALFEPKVVEVTVGETTKYAVEVVMKADAEAGIQAAVDAEAEDLAKAAVKAAADAVAGGEAAVTTTPGLYYVVEAGSELNGIEPASCTLATSTETKLNIPNKGTKGFYKISVSVTPVVVQE